ncbi:MAG: hypothetical protein QHH27_02265 [Clostridia bacterium]|jgi:uncharacterized membrane protein YkvI|nr:hypothetical protein [Clostridia bacterium]MDH7572359.1 hypothetical protein [Clostridia bacterium]
MDPRLSPRTIVATYVGTVVGAAFASGQEILQFFGYFGAWGLAGLLLTTVLFILFGYLIMEGGHRLEARSYRAVIMEAGGPWLGRALDGVVTFFLFGALLIMAAGAGAFFRQHFGLPFALGSAAMVVAAAATVLAGLGGVIAAISIIAPALLLGALGLGAYTVISAWPGTSGGFFWSLPQEAPVPSWPLSSVLYASYNLLLAVAVLAPIGPRARRKDLWLGALGGGTALGLAATSIFLALMAQGRAGAASELPMLAVAARLGPLVAWSYGLILLAEIYTTAVSSLFGFASRLGTEGARFRLAVSAAGAAAFILAQFGFSVLVGTILPAVGYAGLLFLGALALGYRPLREAWPRVARLVAAPHPLRKAFPRGRVVEKEPHGNAPKNGQEAPRDESPRR